MQNPKDISDPTTAIDMTLALMAKAFTLNNTTPINNNQRSSLNPINMHIAQPGMNMNQDRQMLMVENNIVENMNGLSVVSDIENQYGNRNVVTTPAEGNGNGINGNPIRCYNCRGDGHYASNCIVKPRKRDATYLQQQLQISQEEEAGIQSTQEEFKFMAAAYASEETERVKANCILENNMHVAQKFLNEVKSTIVTLKRVVKQKMTLDIHNWSSSAHQEIHKVVKDEIFPIVNQVDARMQNFEIQILKEATKFVRDFKSLAKEADESIAKQKALELEIERLLREVISQDIISVVQHNSVVDSSNLQTELDRTKERFENCIIKKENEYAKLWNDWTNPSKTSRVDNVVPNKPVKASVRTKLITGSQPHVSLRTIYVNGMNSHGKKEKTNASNIANRKKHKAQAWKPKNVGSKERLASPKPSTPRSCLRCSPTERLFDLKGKIISSSKSESQSDCSKVICSTNNSNGEHQVVSKSSAITTADASDKRQQQDSTSSTSTLATTIATDGNFDL
uniref:CCHC-type domain-containing protein n=1 Tax=Tanacetum cinerariifolium TaxID=118510 RepID=A0A6L2L7M8_TANCI|nr:hypothetical protein [Tanacetum cinerariifolium]